jgi:hypothetical protein
MSYQEGGPICIKCDRFAGNLLDNVDTIRLIVSKIMNNDVETMGASIYFHEHRFAVIKVNIIPLVNSRSCFVLRASVISFSLLSQLETFYVVTDSELCARD